MKMDFCEGDIIWIPNEYIDPTSDCKYWPAQFAKSTNMHDIIHVLPYGPEGLLKEQFVVDTKNIVYFEDYRPDASDDELNKVFEVALRDFKSKLKKQRSSKQIVRFQSAREFADYIERLCLEQINKGRKEKEKERQVSIISLFSSNFDIQEFPIDEPSLHIYFRRNVPQILSFLTTKQFQNFTKVDRLIFEKIEEQIIGSMMKKVYGDFEFYP